MAVSNAIGSNVFDILVCLGLPWFIETTMVTPGRDVVVHSKGEVLTSLVRSEQVAIGLAEWQNYSAVAKFQRHKTNSKKLSSRKLLRTKKCGCGGGRKRVQKAILCQAVSAVLSVKTSLKLLGCWDEHSRFL